MYVYNIYKHKVLYKYVKHLFIYFNILLKYFFLKSCSKELYQITGIPRD